MPTAEEILLSQQAAERASEAEQRAAHDARVRDDLEAANTRFAASVEAAAARLEATGFVDGQLKLRWRGNYDSANIAVWYLAAKLPMDSGMYFFAPTDREVVVITITSDEASRHHARDVTNKRMNPARHHAASEGWLMGLHKNPRAEILNSLADALDQLATK